MDSVAEKRDYIESLKEFHSEDEIAQAITPQKENGYFKTVYVIYGRHSEVKPEIVMSCFRDKSSCFGARKPYRVYTAKHSYNKPEENLTVNKWYISDKINYLSKTIFTDKEKAEKFLAELIRLEIPEYHEDMRTVETLAYKGGY